MAVSNLSDNKVSQVNQYDAFGVPAGINNTLFAYTGQLYLNELQLYYYKARIYHPKLGRFLQTDPIGYEDQMNLYAYVGNDPINMVDPTGKVAESIWDASSLSVGLVSLGKNLAAGNWSAAGIDAIGVIADGAALAIPFVPGGASTAISGYRQGADFIASADGAVVRNSTSAVRESLEGAGMSGTAVTNKAGTEAGTIHNVPDMKMDVRVMDGGPNHPPRVVTSRQGSSQPVNPANGKNFGNMKKAEQRAKSHLEVDK
ncbi:MAG: RHS repeat-associated core domain-containing protein [Glaciecola sp.]